MKYEMKIVSSPEEIELAPKFNLFFQWTEKSGPETEGQAVYVENNGFLVKLKTYEKDPISLHKETDGAVHLDSCMEFFANFDPEHDDRYINFESNSNGNLHCKIGNGRKERKPVRDIVSVMPRTKTEICEDFWTLELSIPVETVKALYGKEKFQAGDIIKGNFYRCGDDLPNPHFGMWNTVDVPEPDFHRPEFFGEIVLTR